MRDRASAADAPRRVPGLAYARFGSGPPMLLIHGLGDSRRAWLPLVRALAADFELWAVDLPGCGDTPPPPRGHRHDIADAEAALLRFLDDVGLDRPHIVGNSLGGALALRMAGRGRARSVTALAPVGLGAPRLGNRLLAGGLPLALRVPPALPEFLAASPPGRALARRLIHGNPTTDAARTARFHPEHIRPGTAFVQLAPEVARYRHTGPVPRCPVTVAWGTRDHVVPAPSTAAIRRALPAAHQVTLLGCGHLSMMDDPAAVAATVRQACAGR